jgi:hypothetical protein
VDSLTVERSLELETGAELRLRSGDGTLGLLVLGGTTRALVPGKWSTSTDWLVDRLGHETSALTVGRLRYNIGSWRRLDLLVADTLAGLDALGAAGAERVAILGFSGGGSAGLGALSHPLAHTLIALAPWLPNKLDPPSLDGLRVTVAHGTLDGLPLLPGTRPLASRDSVDRLRGLGADGAWTPIWGGVHAIAVRFGRWRVPAPRAGAWREFCASELARFQEEADS